MASCGIINNLIVFRQTCADKTANYVHILTLWTIIFRTAPVARILRDMTTYSGIPGLQKRAHVYPEPT